MENIYHIMSFLIETLTTNCGVFIRMGICFLVLVFYIVYRSTREPEVDPVVYGWILDNEH